VKLSTAPDLPDPSVCHDILQTLRAASGNQLGSISLHPVTQRYWMVNDDQPTELGLRGLDALRTLYEAKASNQRDEPLLRSIFLYP
jgi:hypothetical protein